jgi:hypothetical protein
VPPRHRGPAWAEGEGRAYEPFARRTASHLSTSCRTTALALLTVWPDGGNASLEGLESPKRQPLESGSSPSGDCRISWRPEARKYLLAKPRPADRPAAAATTG